MGKITNVGPLSIVSYLSFTLIFFIVKGKILPGNGVTWIVIFFVITGLIQFVNNLYLTKLPEVCGEFNIPTALSSTIIPWVFIFGIACTFLILMPGWLRVFSNTFGSSIAEMAGLKEAAMEILGPKKDNPDYKMRQTVELIYTNPTTIINEVDISDYDEPNKSWPSLEKVLKFVGSPFLMKNVNDEQKFVQLHHLLSVKEDVGYFVWFLLIGSISILVSTNTLLLSKCYSVL
jgi:hypothetical protein